MDERALTCCFTGHRPMKLPWGMNEDDPRCLKLKAELAARLEGLYELGFRRFLCGMAIGCDMYFAEAVLALREEYPDVCLEAVIPFGDQPGRWNEKQRRRYNGLIDRADRVTVLQTVYTGDCMMRRNRWMVDRSSVLLACYDGRPGGTMNTILYAERSGLRVLLIEL
ncbi:MAG: SLOG family protein [Eubacteriales bacterium]|nr:SLOG family protein [Eubacteriales bacterium]